MCLFVVILTKLALVLLLSSSGMGKKTARAIQFAKIVNKIMISKVLKVEAQDHDNNTRRGWQMIPIYSYLSDNNRVSKNFRKAKHYFLICVSCHVL